MKSKDTPTTNHKRWAFFSQKFKALSQGNIAWKPVMFLAPLK